MNIKNIINSKAGIIIAVVIAILYFLELIAPSQNIKSQIEIIRGNAQPEFDSLSKQMQSGYSFQENIVRLIDSMQLIKAQHILDSLDKLGLKQRQFIVYQGMIFFQQKKYAEAIEQYNIASEVYNNDYSFAQEKRADVYLKLNRVNEALADYKKAAPIYEYLNKKIAQIFENIHLKDSAIKYYEKYLSLYPKRIDVRMHLDSLVSKQYRNNH